MQDDDGHDYQHMDHSVQHLDLMLIDPHDEESVAATGSSAPAHAHPQPPMSVRTPHTSYVDESANATCWRTRASTVQTHVDLMTPLCAQWFYEQMALDMLSARDHVGDVALELRNIPEHASPECFQRAVAFLSQLMADTVSGLDLHQRPLTPQHARRLRGWFASIGQRLVGGLLELSPFPHPRLAGERRLLKLVRCVCALELISYMACDHGLTTLAA